MQTINQIQNYLNQKYCGQKLVGCLPQIQHKVSGISARNVIDEIENMCKQIANVNESEFSIKPNKKLLLIDGQESKMGKADLYLSYFEYDNNCLSIKEKHKSFGSVLSVNISRDKNYIIQNISIDTKFNSLNELIQNYKSQC